MSGLLVTALIMVGLLSGFHLAEMLRRPPKKVMQLWVRVPCLHEIVTAQPCAVYPEEAAVFDYDAEVWLPSYAAQHQGWRLVQVNWWKGKLIDWLVLL